MFEKKTDSNFSNVSKISYLSKFFVLSIFSTILIIPLIHTTKISYESYLIKNVVLRELGVLLFLAFFIRILYSSMKLYYDRILILVSFFILYLFASVFWSCNKGEAILACYNFVAVFTLFFVSRYFIKYDRERNKIFLLLFSVTSLVSLFSICNRFGYNFYLPESTMNAVSFIGHPNISAQFISISLPLIIVMLFFKTRLWKWSIHILFTFIIIFYLITTECRGAWIGIGISIFISLIFILTQKKEVLKDLTKKDKISIYMLVTLFLIFILILNLNFNLYDRITSILNYKEGGAGFRFYLWQGTLKMIKSNLFFGVGIGNFHYLYPLYRNINEIQLSGSTTYIYNTENDLLQIFAETGLIGLFFSLSIILTILYKGYLNVKNTRGARSFFIHLGIFTGIISCLIHSMFSFNLRSPASSALFWIFCGLITSKNQIHLKTNRAELKPKYLSYNSNKKIILVFITFVLLGISTFQLLKPLVGEYHLKQAKSISKSRNHDNIIKSLNQSTQSYPYNFETWYYQATIFQNMKKFEESIQSIKKSIILHPFYPHSYNILGVNYHNLDNFNEAENSYKKVLQLDPSHETGRKNLALLYKTKGMIEKAIEEYSISESYIPFDEKIKIDIGLFFLEIGDLERAEDYFIKAINLRPLLLDCNGIFRISIEKLKNIESDKRILFRFDARNQFNKQLRKWTEWGSFIIKDIYRGDVSINNPTYGCSLEFDSYNKDLLFKISNVDSAYKYTIQTKYDNIIVDFEIPANAVYHVNAMNNLGIVSDKMNRIDEARDYFLKAIEICPGYLPAFKNLILHYTYFEPSYDEVMKYFNQYKRRSSDADDMNFMLDDIESLK